MSWGNLKPENNFQKACVEFVESERSYVDSLGEMSMTYYWPLMSCFGGTVVKMPSPCPSFTAEHGKVLFGNLEHIVHVSQQFLEKMRNDGAAAILSGEALRTQMTEMIPLLKIYVDYCSGFTASSVLLAKLIHDHADFKAFESQCQRKTNNPLGFYLIMPVQRVPRYKLLLATLITEAEKHNAENKHGVAPRVLEAFQDAFHKVSNVANQINEQLREQENALEISNLTENFVEDPGFAKVGRSLLKRENVLYQKQPALVVLFNDHVAIASKQQAIKALSGVSFSSGLQPLQTRYKLINQITFDHSFKLTLDQSDSKIFTIISGQKYWVVEFETPEKRSDWQKALEEGKMKKISRPRGSRLVSLSVPYRPVLKSKTSAAVCGLCKSRFNMVFKRAKNCKLCGELFCTDCSLSRVQQPPNPKLVRACDACASRVLLEGEQKGQTGLSGGMRASSPSPQRRMGSALRTQSEPPNTRNGISSNAAAFSPLPLPIPRVRSATANYTTGIVQASSPSSPLSPITRAIPPVFVAPLFSVVDDTQATSSTHVLRPAPPTLRAASSPSCDSALSTSHPTSLSLSAASSPNSTFRSLSSSSKLPDIHAERSSSQFDLHSRAKSPPPRSPPMIPPRTNHVPSVFSDHAAASPSLRPFEHAGSSHRTPASNILASAIFKENDPHQFVSSSHAVESSASRLAHENQKPPLLPKSLPPSNANVDFGSHQFVASRPAENTSAPRHLHETNKLPALPFGLPPSNANSKGFHSISVRSVETSKVPHETGSHKPPALPSGLPPNDTSSSHSSSTFGSSSHRSLPISNFENHAAKAIHGTSAASEEAARKLSPSSLISPTSSSSQRTVSAMPPTSKNLTSFTPNPSLRSISPTPIPAKPGISVSSAQQTDVVASAKMLEHKLGSVRGRAQSADFVRPSQKSS